MSRAAEHGEARLEIDKVLEELSLAKKIAEPLHGIGKLYSQLQLWHRSATKLTFASSTADRLFPISEISAFLAAVAAFLASA